MIGVAEININMILLPNNLFNIKNGIFYNISLFELYIL